MALFSNTRDALVEQILKSIMPAGSWYEGTATSGSTSTIADTSRYEIDDYFQNTNPVSRVYIRTTTDNAAPIGEQREVSDFVQNTGAFTTEPDWSATTAAGDTYAVLAEYLWDEVTSAINMAIDKAASRKLLVEKLDTSIILASSVYEYIVPDNFVYIYGISMEDGADNFPEPIPPDHWKIVRGASPPRIHLLRFPQERTQQDVFYGGLWADSEIVAARALQVEGLAKQPRLTSDTDLCELDPEYICHQAAAYLHGKRVQKRENDLDEHAVQYGRCLEIAEAALRNNSRPLPANSRRVM